MTDENNKSGKKNRKPRRIRVSSQHRLNVSCTPLKNEELEAFPLLTQSDSNAAEEAIEWLENGFGISPDILDEFIVRLHVDSTSGLSSVAYPLTNNTGEVVDLFLMPLGASDRMRRYHPVVSGSKRGVPACWFGQHLYESSRSVVLVINPLDAMKLYTLGVTNVLASCSSPSGAQFAVSRSKITYLAFEEDEVGKQGFRDGVRLLTEGTRYLLFWSDVGVKYARGLTTLSQFKAVYQNKRRIGT